MFSWDLNIGKKYVKASIDDKISPCSRGNFRSSRGLFTLLKVPEVEYFISYCCFFLGTTQRQAQRLILFKIVLDPGKLELHFLSV